MRAAVERWVRKETAAHWGDVAHAVQTAMAFTVVALVLALMTGCGSAPNSAQVSIAGVTATHRLQPNTTAQLTFTPANVPLYGSVDISRTQISFTPASGGPAVNATPTVQAAGTGNQVVLTFSVPALTVTTATPYLVSVAGETTRDQQFSSAQSTTVTIDPGATLSSLTPASASVGQTVTVAIAATNTDFVQGQTQANFGAGISVNGAGPSLPGNITITGAGAASATLVIDPAAAAGTRDVTVSTGDQVAILKAGFTVLPVLLPLKASAGGPYQGLTQQAIQFDGSTSSDPNGLALTYAWTFGDGQTGIGAKPTHTYTKAGSYTVVLAITDADNLTASSTTTATITALSNPVAVAGGPYTGTTSQPVSFDGSASTDPNQSALTYSWVFGDGATASVAKPTHAYASAGTFQAVLTVTDTYGLTASSNATVTITNASQKPVAVIGGPYTGTAGSPIQFNGSASTDPNSLSLVYAWDFGDGTVASTAQPQHTYSAAGTYTIKLTVSDSTNLSSSATTTVTVSAATMLTANAGGPYTGTPAQPVTFSGAGSTDPKNEMLTYTWSFGDGNTATGVSPTNTYASAGTFPVTLTVTNSDGATATAATTATITAPGTTLAAIFTGSATGNVSQILSFDGSTSTAPGTDTLTYAWSFGDGTMGTGATVTHAYTAPGSFTVSLIVTDGANQASTTSGVTITQPVALTILTPTQGTLFNTTSVSVTGTADITAQTVVVNGVTATLTSGTFTATVPVREGVNILTATGTAASGNVGTASTSITIDLTPPALSIFQPVDQSTVTTQQLTVTGMITDQVTGTVNANDVTVTINGQPATVANRSFQLSGLILVPGANTLAVVATDKAGNVAQSTVHVNLAPATAQQHVAVLSGNNQTGIVGAVIPQALQVQLQSANGTPVPNRAVLFTVTSSDGQVESLPQQAQTLSLQTDATGKASVLFQLGTRAGLGINQVSVTSPGFLGSAVFTETTTPGAPAYIHEFLGNNQRGILGQPLAQNLQTIVQDTGGNPIANVPVTFTISGGDGVVGASSTGQTTYTVNTNSDGRAVATLTLGQQQGINNNLVTADFPADPNSAVTFYASGFSSGPASNTSVSGIVLDNAGAPVPNATASLLNTSLSTTTDANGHFSLSGAPVGTVTLLVDGSTTTLAETLPSLSFLLQDLPGQNNTLNMPVYLPIVDTSSAQTAGGNQTVTLALKGMAGAGITIAPNSVTFPDGSHVGQLTLSQVKSDLIPMPPPNGIPPAFAWTIQPAGTRFSTPAAITIPNTSGLAPGMVEEFYQYDHDLEQFVSVGTLRVSPDGSVLNSDPGFGITKAGWSAPGANPPPGSCAHSCDDGNPCTQDSMNSHCHCDNVKLTGGGCGNNSTGRDSCLNPGHCKNGACDMGQAKTGSMCKLGLLCEKNGKCQKNGTCVGTQVPDQGGDAAQTFGSISANWTSMTGKLGNSLNARLPGGASVGVSVTPNLSLKKRCCEQHSGDMLPLLSGSVSLGATITSPKASFTKAILGIDVGPFVQAFGTGTFNVSVSYNGCNAPKPVLGLSGGGSLQLGITAGAAAEVTNLLYPYQTIGVNANVTVSTSITVTADAQALRYQYGIDPITLNFVVSYPGGNTSKTSLQVLPAYPIGGDAIANPPPPN